MVHTTCPSGATTIAAVIADTSREQNMRRQVYWPRPRSDTMRQADGKKGIAQMHALAQGQTVTAAR